jgi:hypothetical protein
MGMGSKEVQKTALEGGFIQHSRPQVMNEIRARLETSPGCALKLWDHETRLLVSKTPEWVRSNSFFPLRRSWTIVNFGHGENINVGRREIKIFECCGHCGAAFHGFLSLEMWRRNREEQEELARMGMQPKNYKESPR